ncbi:Psp-related protein [Trichomonas vaginalis G3]|uniref:Psp-related protein n=1 Tax=Trichomonas vaginalis (strain ATCC PRA-98 / G3) TaxID=412133 RepID=A2E8M3_TRIV3|nr:hypothetical protein TVAGG3_0344120 [Trichomonas vaginalis G3]EAY10962.1 Psp-related protein [Trichomonas vaginalis G3]KAI5530845.1 hypothetical protein TVAGG3_0344120 [Trichomonas vaginalis G3]|eukprot:XP_001323185.1 Psp-related protein [Trichomonas vaginalis G3]
MSNIPEEFAAFGKYYNYAQKINNEPTRVVLTHFFLNQATDIINEGGASEEAVEFYQNVRDNVREFQEEDVTNTRHFVNAIWDDLTGKIKNGVRKNAMIGKLLMMSAIYGMFDDDASAKREKDCKIFAIKLKKQIEQNGESDGNEAPAEDVNSIPQKQDPAPTMPSMPPPTTPQPNTYQMPPPSAPAENPYVPPSNPYVPPSEPAPKPTPPPQDPPKPAPKPADPPKPAPKPAAPAAEPCASIPNCKYNREPALQYFKEQGIPLVTKCYPQPDPSLSACIQRYLDYAVSRLYADMYSDASKLLQNALQSWKTGKPQ